MKNMNPKLYGQLVTLISGMGYELLGCELVSQGRQLIFRVYIDSQNGVTVDDCTRVSRQVGTMLDVEDHFQGRYTLEVSSPGIDRPLFEIGHYHKYLGSRVKIKLSTPINQRRQYNGVLKCVEGEDVHLLVDDLKQEVILPFSMIEKTNLIWDVI